MNLAISIHETNTYTSECISVVQYSLVRTLIGILV